MGPAKWTYFYLYVILDIFSRYAVGWMVASRESATLAQKLIRETCHKQGIARGQLTVHADRGSSMTSRPVALLLADLGVTKTHSRPHTSNDNPFSESHFKTLKYRPEFPDRFGCIQDARAFCQRFFCWYNTEHHHSAIGWLTPQIVIAASPLRCWRPGRRCWIKLSNLLRNALFANRRNHPNCSTKSGSTLQTLRSQSDPLLTKFSQQVSQNH